MNTADFDFELPAAQIAQRPTERREESRLFHVRRSGERAHRRFTDLIGVLRPGDLLVLNDTRVIPARLLGKKAQTGGRVELLLVKPHGDEATATALAAAGPQRWRCLGQASKPLRVGQRVDFATGLSATIDATLGEGAFDVTFDAGEQPLRWHLERAGEVPLPPYIDRAPGAQDVERYQTVFAQHDGSVAAPTAGLHFTPQLLEQAKARGVLIASVTLDVGPGTFLPVRDGDVRLHRMHAERYAVPSQTATAIASAKAEGRRVVAVGTTVVRTLEASAALDGQVRAGRGETDIFITPGFRFRVVDALLTNFHLPKSTLLMLVCAFLGHREALAAYREAVAEGYRFFSYGDAMFIED